jgi:hypothetical protein
LQLASITIARRYPPAVMLPWGSSQDTLSGTYVDWRRFQYNLTGRVGGLTPVSYAAVTLPVIYDEQVSATVLAGYFGSEAVRSPMPQSGTAADPGGQRLDHRPGSLCCVARSRSSGNCSPSAPI